MDSEHRPPSAPYVIPGLDQLPLDVYFAQPRQQKFRHRYSRHILLFVVTFLTATFCQAFIPLWSRDPNLLQFFTWTTFVHGLWQSVPLLTILSAHEFGHYFACRYHDVDATLPFFLPAPIPLTGTFGAVIKIREAFPTKRALFDIGVAGPIAGFLALLPFLFFGLSLSEQVPLRDTGNMLMIGDPLLLKVAGWCVFGSLPDGYTVSLHGMAFAAWWGMLATALNLIPFGQLDGGHIAYALFGRRAVYVSFVTLGAAMVLTFFSPSLLMTTVMMLVMALSLGLHHPQIADEATPLDPTRRLVAALSLVIFVLCFTPFPIQTFFGK